LSPITNGYVGVAPDLGALEYGRAACSAGARSGTTPTPYPVPVPTPTPVPPPPPPPTVVTSARSVIEAEMYTASNGTVTRGATNIGSLDAGEWVKYGPIDFGTGIKSFTARLAVSDAAA